MDVGSTFTKGALVEVPTGRLLASAQHPTTAGPDAGRDVLEGVDAVLARLGHRRGDRTLACSSAGGGLRLAVVGQERKVTAEAGTRVGLSAGGRVVHVAAGPLDASGLDALAASRPDVVLLVGGTDGGNAEVLLHNAQVLARSPLRAPVVVAGNAAARDEVCAVLQRRRKRVIPTANVLPRIGVVAAAPARAAIREVFLRHVIGGKGLAATDTSRRRLTRLVRAATPDAVLAGVELLADGTADAAGDRYGWGGVVVVDVGGATTDVYSVVTPDPEEAALRREVVEVLWRGRTVEGDLGMRWSAPGVVAAAARERLLEPGEEAGLAAAAQRRAADPAYLAGQDDRVGGEDDARLAGLAMVLALRRHARPVREEGVAGQRDLRGVHLVVGSGGVLRYADRQRRQGLLAAAVGDRAGGWRAPERARLAVDEDYVLAAVGLLAMHGQDGALAAGRLVRAVFGVPGGELPTAGGSGVRSR